METREKAKFLKEVGGGVIVDFQGNNIVQVKDSDGYHIPTDVNDVVVEGRDNYAPISKATIKQTKTGQQPQMPLLPCSCKKIYDTLFDFPIYFHIIQINIFFDEKASIYPLIENSQPMRILFNTGQLNDNSYKDSTINLCGGKVYSYHPKILSYDRPVSRSVIVDLHANELLDATNGLFLTDILIYRNKTYLHQGVSFHEYGYGAIQVNIQ